MVDSRDANEGRSIRRRRECESCEHRFTTFERIESTNFIVIKKTVHVKAMTGKSRAWNLARLEKDPSLKDQVTTLLDSLESLEYKPKRSTRSVVGRDVMHALKMIDEVAYILCFCLQTIQRCESFKKRTPKTTRPLERFVIVLRYTKINSMHTISTRPFDAHFASVIMVLISTIGILTNQHLQVSLFNKTDQPHLQPLTLASVERIDPELIALTLKLLQLLGQCGCW